MKITKEEAIVIARHYIDRKDAVEVFTVIEYEECFSVSFDVPPWPGGCPKTPIRVEVDKATKVPRFPWLELHDEAEESGDSDEKHGRGGVEGGG
ncbi:MAG TPA: hypothetical protein VFB66_01120 [Tepidisphaeraceae bacterium]|nr:hypothetical protein [Tepidisphaeraceae bacterium]